MSEKTNITFRERLSSPLTWHVAGFSILLIVLVVLATRFALDWVAISSSSAEAYASKQVELKAMEMQTAPLRGLDKRVAESHDQIKTFYADRLPANYSSFAIPFGDLQVKSGVHVTRIGYSQGKPGPDLTEIFIDANLIGDYPQIMRFVNSLERSKTFFVVRQMNLTGQQGGMVNLRLQVSTWMLNDAAAASGLPKANQKGQPQNAQPAAAPAGAAAAEGTTPAGPGEGE
jgi:type IV pilus assembly protein PilO